MKRCRICQEDKPLSEFYRSSGMRDGYRSECKACNLAMQAQYRRINPEAHRQRARDWARQNPERVTARALAYRKSGRKSLSNRKSYLKRTFGMTIAEYDQMLADQSGGCAICERRPPPGSSLHIDHNHATGRIRGLLCFRCNNALGDLDDSAALLHAAANYLGPAPKEPELVDRLEGLKALRRW